MPETHFEIPYDEWEQLSKENNVYVQRRKKIIGTKMRNKFTDKLHSVLRIKCEKFHFNQCKEKNDSFFRQMECSCFYSSCPLKLKLCIKQSPIPNEAVTVDVLQLEESLCPLVLFISYDYAHYTDASIIRNMLKSDFNVWFDEKDMNYGENVHESMNEGISLAWGMIVCATANYYTRPDCRNELCNGHQKRVRLMPIKMENFEYEGFMQQILGSMHYVDFTTPDKRKTNKATLIPKLINSLARFITTRRKRPENSPVKQLNKEVAGFSGYKSIGNEKIETISQSHDRKIDNVRIKFTTMREEVDEMLKKIKEKMAAFEEMLEN